MDNSLLNKYLDNITKDPNHRYRSWEHCFCAFQKHKNDINLLSLHLAFYLASWGMMRGSCGLLQKDYLVHKDIIEKLLLPKYFNLSKKELSREDIPTIIELKDNLSKLYSNIKFINSKGVSTKISATDTLLSKVILGALGCTPAFDRYFLMGAKKINLNITGFNQKSLENIFKYISENKVKPIKRGMINYPVMKVIDMYFWEKGFEL